MHLKSCKRLCHMQGSLLISISHTARQIDESLLSYRSFRSSHMSLAGNDCATVSPPLGLTSHTLNKIHLCWHSCSGSNLVYTHWSSPLTWLLYPGCMAHCLRTQIQPRNQQFESLQYSPPVHLRTPPNTTAFILRDWFHRAVADGRVPAAAVRAAPSVLRVLLPLDGEVHPAADGIRRCKHPLCPGDGEPAGHGRAAGRSPCHQGVFSYHYGLLRGGGGLKKMHT